MDDPDWVSRAKPVDGALVEVAFRVADSFYFGPANDFSDEQWQSLREPCYQPAVLLHQGWVLTRSLAESSAELVKHYADVVRLRDKYGKRWAMQPSYIWMRPLIFRPGVFEICFSWYDTWEETKFLLDALEGPEKGDIFSDVEQGWDVAIVASRERLFIRQGDFDSGEEQECVSCDRSELVRQIPPLRARCERILEDLCGQLGHNYWSRR